MKEKNKYFSLIISIVLSLLIWGAIALVYDFYYDMNDDVLIKDILSGVYTGKPDGHNMQMQFALGCIFALMYRILPQIPWMGLVEVLLMATCFGMLVYRATTILNFSIKKRYRVLTGILTYLAVVIFTLAGVGYEIVIIQYTFVCGVLALTAGVLVATDTGDVFKIKNNIIPIILAILAFNFRSEMFLLMCPFLAVAGMYRWMREGINIINVKRYLAFLAIVFAGIAVSFGIEELAYHSEEWQEFREFFDARTRVYDFTGIAPYEGNENFYNELGLTSQDVKYLEEYNFTSFKADTDILNSIADYSSSDAAVTTKSHKSLKYAIKEYVVSSVKVMLPHEWRGAKDEESAFYEDGRISAPYNLILLVLYLILIAAIIISRDKIMLLTTLLLLAMRSISWIYVIYKDRVNARIAHPMYIFEIILIMSVLMLGSSDYIRMLALASLIIIAGMYIPAVFSNIGDKITIREENNQVARAVYEYTSSHPESYYYLDVYTMTGCSEKIFVKRTYGKGNTQLTGGWIALSPLDRYKQNFYKDTTKKLITRDTLDGKSAMTKIDVEGSNTALKVYIENDK